MTKLALGIDIGGTKIAAGLVTDAGEVLARAQTPTPARLGARQILETAVQLSKILISEHGGESGQPLCIGIGSAGVINPATHQVVSATDHLSGWVGADIGTIFRNEFSLPTVVHNDVHSHAVGEALAGAGQEYSSVLMVAAGTGIGGAVIIDGTVDVGKHGAAGHLGHTPCAEAAGLPCPCGKMGHVEAIGSGTGLYQLYARLGGDPRIKDSREVVASAAGDPLARQAILTSAGALGRALGGIVNLIDPAVVIISGGMINAGDLWWDTLDQGVRESVMPILQDVPLIRAQLGDDAAIIGAALQAFESVQRNTHA